MKSLHVAFIFLFTMLSSLTRAAQSPASYVWLEGEKPTTANIPFKPSTWANVMSGDNWLHISIDAADVEKKVPAEGVLLGYDFNTSNPGPNAIWNRIGFEFVRSRFEWRIEGVSDWKGVEPTEITTDLTEIGFWAEVAWLKLGELELPAGKHRLEIRLPRSFDAQHKPERVLYASDAICIAQGEFRPDGKYPPASHAPSPSDLNAQTHKFEVPGTGSAAQSKVSLKGDWMFARWDEDLVQNRTSPIKTLPDPGMLHWSSMAVPSNRNKSRPEMTFAHRYLLRTTLHMPANRTSNSYFLHIPSVNFITSLFVNGTFVDSTTTPYAVWDPDITRFLKDGDNDVCLAIKDTYYALDPSDGKNLRYSFVLPTEFFNSNQGVSMQLDYPVWNHNETGILQEPTIIVAGQAYTQDVFCIPSVSRKTLGLEITLRNPSRTAVSASIENSVAPLTGGPDEKIFAPQTVQIEPGSEKVIRLSEGWTNPRLWQTDDPFQYLVKTRVRIDGKLVDERVTKFGFREWSWQGGAFALNGIPWHGRADLAEYGKANEQALNLWRKHGQTMQRVWAETDYNGLEMEPALDFFDSHGMPVRRTGIFDGEGANYGLVQRTNVNGKEITVARKALFDHFREQLKAWVKSQRNHPSIFVWSMENEITFINANVFGLNEYTDPEMKHAAEELAAIDPTRPQMTDGGNALLDASLPIYGGHYLEADFSFYPEEAYTLAEARKSGTPGHQRWPLKEAKPILMGESFFAQGNDAASLAAVGGESAFGGKAESYPAMGLVARMLSEGYRWSGVNFHFWMGGESETYYNAWQPVAVLCRQWDWRFAANSQVTRTLKIFNDTRSKDPILLSWTLVAAGKPVASGSSTHSIGPGESETLDIRFQCPATASRLEGSLNLTLSVKGVRVFSESKPLSILPAPALDQKARLSLTSTATRAAQVTVLDPTGQVIKSLRSIGIEAVPIAELASLPATAKVLVIGRNALSATESGSSKLAAFAQAGHSIIVLEQQNPLRYQGLPADMSTAHNSGYFAFCENLDHPIFKGLAQQDFAVWTSPYHVYEDAYEKPTRGARSLVQCGNGLNNCAMAEMQVGGGVLITSQLCLQQSLPSNPVARQLLANLISYGLQYRLQHREVSFVPAGDSRLTAAMQGMGVIHKETPSAEAAMARPGSIAVINATPQNLKTLASEAALVNSFTKSGGWIVLCGLAPEGLADYNRIVGFDHMIRPFQREKVSFPAIRSPLLAGLPASMISMSSGQRIFGWRAGDYPDTNAFSYVVDYEDVAPFAKSSFFAYPNIVNNFVSADGWPLIINFEINKDGSPYDVPISFPKPQVLREFTWVGNVMYWPQTKVNLLFGKDPASRMEFKTRPDDSPQTFAISPPRTVQDLTLQIAGWEPRNGVNALVGIDNIYLKAQRPPDFYTRVKPLLNIGAMMAYPRGAGGIVLCNVKFMDSEAVPENQVKKRNILSTLLRNLQAPFSGGKSVIAGANLEYTPIDISRNANAYRTEKGWFGDRNTTFNDLPTGKHTFAGVAYNVYDFATSPVPTVIMLGGQGVPGNLPDQVNGIPVNRKADALFFLQTARIDQRRNRDEIRDNKSFEIAAYIVHYADGTQERIPIHAEIDVDDYREEQALPLAGAQVAWSKPYTGTKLVATAYSMQWNNPKPGVLIQSIDLVTGPDKRGVPALLALTAASAR